jgi:glycosidase
MSTQPSSISEIDLAPISGKSYFDGEREWREEFIYFLLVDRFHDDKLRTPVNSSSRSAGSGTLGQLKKFCGGTLKGIKDHIDYIETLGCTSIWLSPVFENNDAPNPDSDKYHGYSIQNYLDIDPRFGTKQDLIDLVDAAHARGMRIFLDVVTNHSGDNWAYPHDDPYFYFNDIQFPFGGFRRPDRPLPKELQNPNFYHRRGQIRNFDDLREAQRGDFFTLKDFNNDEDADGFQLLDTLVRTHCYWIREADIDGLRMDAVKHMGEIAVARFCSAVREYAYSLGKRRFFLFGELIAGDDAIDRYTGPNTPSLRTDRNVFFGLSSVLDFPLSFVLPGVIKGFGSPQGLLDRYEALRGHALNRGELGRYLVTFVDNHDQVGQNPKRRFGADCPDEQIIAAIGYLLCALGTPCIYYGTEQGFSGKGDSDALIREAMFDLQDAGRDFLNRGCTIYKQISQIAQQFKTLAPLRFGRMYFREISGNGVDFGPPQGHPCTLAFSRILASQEILVAYNTSSIDRRRDFVIVDSVLQSSRSNLKLLYSSHGQSGVVPVRQHANGSRFVQLPLAQMEFVILA